jgi:DNA primase small subunit
MARGEIGTVTYLKNRFKEYYLDQSDLIQIPPSFKQREFGFLFFDGRTMFRHIAFTTKEELRNYLEIRAPAHVYYSSAYYESPEEEMIKKTWLGADLVFDIDADHIETSCKEEHDQWICRSCGVKGRGIAPRNCPNCSGVNFKEEKWLCEKCLEVAKFETLKLLDILVQDLGLSLKKNLTINFSGHRGYHVHVYEENVHQLDQLPRRELVDYIMGIGIDARFHGFNPSSQIEKPALSGVGWGGRLARALYTYFFNMNSENIKGLELDDKGINVLLNRKEEVLQSLEKEAPKQIFKILGQKYQKTFDKLVKSAVKLQGSAIDTVVTTDIHRLIRLPMTLHGKTGLRAEKVQVDELEGFDPLGKAVAFNKGEIMVQVTNVPEFRVGEEVFGPFKNEKVELPEAAAMLLLCKGFAKVFT